MFSVGECHDGRDSMALAFSIDMLLLWVDFWVIGGDWVIANPLFAFGIEFGIWCVVAGF